MKRKFIVTALLSLMLTIFIVPSAIYAADDETIVCDVNVSKTEEITPDAPEGDELFEQYCDKVFYGKDQKTDAPSPKKGRVSAADSLGTVEKGVYTWLKPPRKTLRMETRIMRKCRFRSLFSGLAATGFILQKNWDLNT